MLGTALETESRECLEKSSKLQADKSRESSGGDQLKVLASKMKMQGEDETNNIIYWLRQHGANVSETVHIKTPEDGPHVGIRGVYATTDIPEGTILSQIPK